MSLVISASAPGVRAIGTQASASLVAKHTAYDEAFRRYHMARTDEEMDAALRDIEAAERELEALIIPYP